MPQKNSLFPDSESAVKSWVKGVIDEVKKAFGINQGRSLMRDEVGKVLANQLGEGLEANSKQTVSAFKKMKKEIDYLKELDLITEEEYYTRLEALRDRYFAKGTENWVKYSVEIYNYQKDLLEQETENLTAIYDNVSEYAEDRLSQLRKKHEKLSKELLSFGGIYSKNTVRINGEKDTYYSTRDISSDIVTLNTYIKRLGELKKLLEDNGFSDDTTSGFLDEVNAMGTKEGTSFMNSLLSKGRSKVVEYVSLWNDKRMLAEGFSSGLMLEEAEEIAGDVAEVLKASLEKAGYEIPEGFFESGKQSGINFGRAFMDELDNQLAEIRNKISTMPPLFVSGTSYGNTYNSTTQYNISGASSADTVEQIRRYDTVKRLMGE